MAVITSKVVQVAILGPELLDNFADNSWEAIIWACQTGNVPESWQAVEACQKPMTIGGVDYPINIIGLGHDEYADGSGKAPITFQMLNCYGTNYAMNTVAINTGGWDASNMRKTHLPAVLALMPEEARSAIREVKKKTSAGNKSGSIITSADKLFLLSEVEIFGSRTYSFAGEGSQYEYYAAGNSKRKTKGGSATGWLERSPYTGDAEFFCDVFSGGTSGLAKANNADGVAFAFCF